MAPEQEAHAESSAAGAVSAGAEEVEAPQAPAPQEVLYCQVCTFPPEYCEFGSHVTKCRAWLESAHPEVYAKVWSEEALSANLASMTTKQAEDLEKEAAKKERKAEAKAEKEKAQKAASKIVLTKAQRTKKKATTTVFGLHHFTPPLPNLKTVAKALASRLATGASIAKAASNPQLEEIVIQGDVADEVKAMIVNRQKPFNDLPAESAGGVAEKNIVIEEEKAKKKAEAAAPAAADS